ncbi:MAG TPA: CPBP family intramembrane glutamic endopeptidase [Candidatus Acidoferrales bacterium]|nr:CPBP family intramembrane glutamic endopeptidase [Candidatus Acidoferrales bacterium]
MQANEVRTAANPEEQIASWRHFAGFLLIGAGVVALGFLAQHAPTGSSASASSGQLGRHSQAVHIYLAAILMDWALLYYCWLGVRRHGGNLKTLSGGRWTSWTSVATDLAIAVPFWALWEAAAYGVHWLLGPSSARSVDSLLPQSVLEILIWIATSISAGICEEIAFRGYVQKQFNALTGSVVMAVLGQGLVFGLFHSYQGWKNVVVICVLGVLLGILAAWRRNLRTNIMVHAWADVWSGWLSSVVWR